MRISSFVPSEEIFNSGLDGIKVGKKDNDGELFSNVLKESLDKINEQQIVADKSTEAFVKGEDIDISEEEILKFKTACMLFFAKEYYDLDWAMQLHFGVKRENNSKLFEIAGANSGCDCIQKVSLNELVEYMDTLNSIGKLPRTILYSLNPLDNAIIGTIIGCFQGDGIPGKIQQGAAWWFNDHKRGIEDQMKSLGELGLLGNFIGMLTDSRSFVSYVRHDYFRRIMCNLIGEWVNSGEYPYEIEILGKLVRDISYNNCKRYFKFCDKDLVGGSYELGNGMVEL